MPNAIFARRARRSLALLGALIVCGLSASVGSAHDNGTSLWTPALCKTHVVQYGVEIGDGRTFRALSPRDVVCIGAPYCEFDRANGAYYYEHFTVLLVDRNLVYRTMTMHVIDDTSSELTNLRTHGRVETVSELQRFRANAKRLARQAAANAQGDCAIS